MPLFQRESWRDEWSTRRAEGLRFELCTGGRLVAIAWRDAAGWSLKCHEHELAETAQLAQSMAETLAAIAQNPDDPSWPITRQPGK